MAELCLELCTSYVPVWTNFPPATLNNVLFYDGKIILTSEEKEEAKETKALEVDTDGNNDKNEKND